MTRVPRNRAWRRAQRARLKRYRRSYWSCGAYDGDEPSARRVGRVATTPCACSCLMCCNPRRWMGNAGAGKTIQEHVENDKAQDSWLAYFDEPQDTQGTV